METLFDEQFQKHFLNHCLRDSHFLTHVIDDVTPDLFTGELPQRVARLIFDHGRAEGSAPDTLVFKRLDDWKAQKLISEDAHKSVSSFLDELFALQLQNREYLLREFDKFVRHQLFAKNIIPAAKHVKDGDFATAEKLLAEAFTFRAKGKDDLGRRYDDNETARAKRRKSEDPERFYLLIPELDEHLGGHMRGELFVWQSQRSSAGKSAAMVLCARNFVFQAKRVMIITLEMSVEKYEDRLDMCIAGIAKDGLLDTLKIQPALRRMFRHGGDIWIKQFPGQLTTIDDLRKYVTQVENIHGFHPDVIILDYADELAPIPARHIDNSHDAGKQIYGMLRAWAIEDRLFIMTGMQSNRSAMEATQADQEHAGGSLAKMFIADTVVSINRTAEEHKQGLTTCYVVKHREGSARFSVSIKTDFARMQFWHRGE